MSELTRVPIGFTCGASSVEAAFCSQTLLLLRGEVLWPEEIAVKNHSDEVVWLLENGFFIKRIGYEGHEEILPKSLQSYSERMMYVEDARDTDYEDIAQTLATGGIVQAFRNQGKQPTFIYDTQAKGTYHRFAHYWMFEPLPNYTTDAELAFPDFNADQLSKQNMLGHPTYHIFDQPDSN